MSKGRFLSEIILFLFFSFTVFSKENYLLLTIDTVRADHLSLYGYKYQTSPFLDSLKNEAIVFKNAYSLVPLTFPSHITMLTGKTPFETGIFLNGQKLEENKEYLPKIFKEKGYKTAGFVSSAILNSMFGLGDGFEFFSEVSPEKGEVIKERSCKDTNAEIFKFLKQNKEPFFMWVHYFEPHFPYTPPPPYDKEFENPFVGEIRAIVDCIKELFENLPKKTNIIIASDHGEMLGEHGEEEHGVLLYEPAIKVPLIILKKGAKPGIRKEFVSLDEIYSTFLNFLDKKNESLLNFKKEKPILSSSLYGREVLGFYPAYATIFNYKKLINYGNKEYLLFDLKEDPYEKNNIFSSEVSIARDLKKIQDLNPFPEKLKIALTDEEKKVLTSLGYSAPKKMEKLIHPEIGLLFEKDKKLAEKLISEKKYPQAEQILLSILEKEPNYGEAKRLLGKLYLKTGQREKAMGTFSNFAFGGFNKNPREEARAKYNEGKIDFAIKIMEEETLLNPNSTNYDELSFYYFQAQKYDKLKNLYDNSIKQNIKSSALFSYLGLVFLSENKIDQADELFEKALKINPKIPQGIKGKGIVLFLKNNFEESINYLENYIGMNPRDWEGYYYKGKVLLNLGKIEQAKNSFENAKEYCKDENSIKMLQKEIENFKKES